MNTVNFKLAILVILGQVDSLELPETPEITEMTEKFTKGTKYLTKFQETLINYVWEKSNFKKQQEWNFPEIPGFRMCSMVRNKNPEMPEINKKLSN